MIKMKNETLFLREVCTGGDGTNAVFIKPIAFVNNTRKDILDDNWG